MTDLHWRTFRHGGGTPHAMPYGTTAALCGADPARGWSRRWWSDAAAEEYLTRCQACVRLMRERVMR